MDIVLCADDNYAMPCGVCLTSLFENNRDTECNVYILTVGFSEATNALFAQLSEKYQQTIQIVPIDSSLFQNLKVSDRFRESIYYRFLIPDIVKGDKALYLDCDIIVTSSLKELWETDVTDYACAAVEDQRGDDIVQHNRIEMYSTYFNSGVLLMNLNYWRQHDVKQQLVDYIYENPDRCLYPDQDALNVVLEHKVLLLDYKYNYQQQMSLPSSELYLHRSKWAQANKYMEELPVIIHYSSNLKPWHVEYPHFYKSIFFEYKSKSPWASYEIHYGATKRERYYSSIMRYVRKLLSMLD